MTTLTESLKAVFVRDLTTLRMEIEAYPSDPDLWRVVPGLSNSGGTLALHLAGNLQHFIGAVLGKSGYVRNRDAEFGTRGVARAELIQQVDQAIDSVSRVLSAMDPAMLQQPYPLPVANVQLVTGDLLLHLATHFTYHLGQLDYHRRMVTAGAALSGALSPTRLASATPVASS